MTYTYAYKTSDGLRHEATIEAVSRTAVFASLRAQGVRPIKVVAADGSKDNGEVIVRGVRRRIVALGTLCLLTGAIIAAVWAFRAGEQSMASLALPRQILDLPKDDVLRTLFPNAAHCQLLQYAVPGREVPIVQSINLNDACARVILTSGEPEEISRLKRILIGLQLEAQRYRNSPNGARDFLAFLNERQQMEKLRFADLLRRVEQKEMSIYDANQVLRAMGLQSED